MIDGTLSRALAEAIGERYRQMQEDERAFVEGLSESEIRQRLEELAVIVRRAKRPALESELSERLEAEKPVIGAAAFLSSRIFQILSAMRSDKMLAVKAVRALVGALIKFRGGSQVFQQSLAWAILDICRQCQFPSREIGERIQCLLINITHRVEDKDAAADLEAATNWIDWSGLIRCE